MPEEPQIKLMSYEKRQRFFFVLLGIFIVVLPLMILHMSGYRLDFENEDQAFVTTGGIYVTTDNLEVEVFIDEEQVERPRLFRSAYYIQNISAGQHRVVVQGEGVHTWVKVLPVDPHIVIEAAPFNIPTTPRVRPISQLVSADGEAVFAASSSPKFLEVATTSTSFIIASSSATSSYLVNQEYLFVDSFFGTSTTPTPTLLERWQKQIHRFGFATTTKKSTTTLPERIQQGDMEIIERDGELVAVWNGPSENVPHYFCVSSTSLSNTAERYGEHVAVAIENTIASTSTELWEVSGRWCRPEIKLDRLRQDVRFYDFFPNSSDLVLLQLEDGLYVTEIDDRSWQNTQLLYPGTDLKVLLENNVIYVEEDGFYFELLTTIAES